MIVVQLCNKTGRVGTNVSERVAKKGESEICVLLEELEHDVERNDEDESKT